MPTPASAAAASGGTSSSHAGVLHDHPIGALLLGSLLVFFALWGVTVQLTTSEAWFMGQSVTDSIAPHFGILAQPVAFFQGKMTGLQLEAFTYAWGVETVQFLFSTGLVFATLKHNRVASWICLVGCVLIMLLDSVADYQFNSAANGWQQVGFSLVVFMMAFGLTYYALHLIIARGLIAAWQKWVPRKLAGVLSGILLVLLVLLAAGGAYLLLFR
jgi:hypothetical protein